MKEEKALFIAVSCVAGFFILALLGVAFIIMMNGLFIPSVHELDRDDFSIAVNGKSRDEIILAVGRPDFTHGSGAQEWWRYEFRVRNETTGKLESGSIIHFDLDGKGHYEP